jgi:hypothetical protein
MASTARQIEDVQGVETHGDADPTHTSIDTAANQMGALVIGIRDHIIGPATQLRDRIDGVIRNTNKRADDLTAEIERFRNDGNSHPRSLHGLRHHRRCRRQARAQVHRHRDRAQVFRHRMSAHQ